MILERLIALNARQTKEQTRAFVKECPLQDYADSVTSAEADGRTYQRH